MERVQCHLTHRFNCLATSLHFTDWDMINGSPVNKTMFWDFNDTQVWWEYHDGVSDTGPLEATTTLERCISLRDHNKRFLYVKPNLSPTMSKKHLDIAKIQNITLLTSHKWSMYESYQHIINHRHDARQYRSENLNTHFNGRQHFLFSGRETPERSSFLTKAKTTYGDDYSSVSAMHREQYINTLLGASYVLQPHGAGPRHAIYEAMALGVPSIIPDSSYLDDITRSCNIIIDQNGDLPTNLPVPGSCEYQKMVDDCINTWETFMTPEAIVQSVLTTIHTQNTDQNGTTDSSSSLISGLK